MTKVRKRHNAEFKSKVAIEAIKEHKTINELTAEYGVHATQISNWKKQALASYPVPLIPNSKTTNKPSKPLSMNFIGN